MRKKALLAPQWLWVIIAVLAAFIAFETWRRPIRRRQPEPLGATERTVDAFRNVRSVTGRSNQERREEAAVLAQRADGDSWLILLLTDEGTLSGFESMPRARIEGIRDSDLAPVASLLESIRPPASGPVLWAITTLLSETRRAEWGEDHGFIIGYHSDHMSDPIREMAREALRRCLGEDHGYDKEAWRGAILDFRGSSVEGAGKGGGPVQDNTPGQLRTSGGDDGEKQE